jgi:hypothetical protein
MHTYPKFSGYTYIHSTYQDAIPYSTCKILHQFGIFSSKSVLLPSLSYVKKI